MKSDKEIIQPPYFTTDARVGLNQRQADEAFVEYLRSKSKDGELDESKLEAFMQLMARVMALKSTFTLEDAYQVWRLQLSDRITEEEVKTYFTEYCESLRFLRKLGVIEGMFGETIYQQLC